MPPRMGGSRVGIAVAARVGDGGRVMGGGTGGAVVAVSELGSLS